MNLSPRSIPRANARQETRPGGVLLLVLILLTAPRLAAPAHGETPESTPAKPLARYSFETVQMGANWRFVLYAENEKAANHAFFVARDRIAELDRRLSDYRDESELSRLNRTAGMGQAVPVSADLWRIVTAAQQLSELSDGAFDLSVGPMVRLWRRARRHKELPKPSLLAEAREQVGFRFIELDPDRQAVELTCPGMRLDPGGIAMGYAADEALRLMRRQGVTRVMIDASGDILCGDAPPGRDGWRIGLDGTPDDPTRRQYLSLANASLTTSGDAFQHLEIDGVRYSHIIDPRTGLGLTHHTTVTVIAPDGMTADSVATAVSVLGVEKGLAWIEARPDLAAHFIMLQPGKEEIAPARVVESSRFADYRVRNPPAD